MIIKAIVSLKSTRAGGRTNPIQQGYRPNLVLGNKNSDISIIETSGINPGDSGRCTIKILNPRLLPNLRTGMIFDISEDSKIIGAGVITEVPDKVVEPKEVAN